MARDEVPPRDGRSTRWAGHREQRRDEIVDRAVALIATHGPLTSVEDIARACGVTRQVLYRQFDGREDLDNAIAERCAGMMLAHLEQHLHLAGGVAVSVRRAIDTFLDFALENRGLYAFARATDERTTGRRVADRVTEVLELVVSGLARDLLDEGPTPVPVDDVLAVGLVAMGESVVTRWLDDPDPRPREELVDGLVAMALGAVSAALPDPGATATRSGHRAG